MEPAFITRKSRDNTLSGTRGMGWRKSPGYKSYLLILIAFVSIGLLLFSRQRQLFLKNQHQELEAISNLKGTQIESWLMERKQDIRLATIDYNTARWVHRLEKAPNDDDTRNKLLEHLEAFRKTGYFDILILDLQGNFKYSAKRYDAEMPPSLKELALRSIREGSPVYSPLYNLKSPEGEKIVLDLFAPLVLQGSSGPVVVGVIALRIDAAQVLFPLTRWPIPANTAENLLVIRDGDGVLVLNDLINEPDTALKLRFPIDRRDMVSVKAVLGARGIIEGTDYRGVPVVAAIRPISGSTWLLVSKVTQKEAYRPLWNYLAFYLLVAGFLSFSLFFAARILWSGKFIEVLNEEKARTERYLNIAGVMIGALNPDGKIILMNQSGCDILGARKDDLIGRSWFDVCFPQEDRENARRQFQTAIGAAFQGFEDAPVVAKSGKKRYLRFHHSPITDAKGKVSEILFSGMDVTPLKETENALIESRAMAQSASTAKSQFLSNMSHEIRTPLNAIIGFSSLLESDAGDENQKLYLEKINSAGVALLEIINNVLDLSKIESGRFYIERKSFSLEALVADLSAVFEPLIRKPSIGFTFKMDSDVPKQVCGDQTRIRQVLTNLLSNAVKFTNEGEIALVVKKDLSHGRDSNWIQFTVSDTGRGIPQTKLPLLFQRFSQVDNSITKEFGGTGLGLSICKELADLMSGHIEVTSREGHGSVFTLHLPLDAAVESPQASAPSTSEANEAGSLRILLVDDAEDNRLLIMHYLKGFPYEIDSETNGCNALKAFKANDYDLVLMDMQMPVMDGFEATKEIRAWEKSNARAPTPIVALTAFALSNDVAKMKEAGCDEHLPKPVKKSELIETIRRLLTQRRNRYRARPKADARVNENLSL